MLYAVMQTAIVAVIVVFSAWRVARKYLPDTTRGAQARMARFLDRRGLHRLGHALQPAGAPASGCGDGGCESCGGCSLSALDALKSEAKK